jgi:hypothetical protein
MTRSSTFALVTLLVGLLSLAAVGTVNAENPCAGFAQEHCEQMEAAADATLFLTTPVHILSGTGIGQERFEAMSNTDGSFRIASPANFSGLAASQSTAPYIGVAREQYEAMQAGQFAALSLHAAYQPGYAFEHYEQMLAASTGN